MAHDTIVLKMASQNDIQQFASEIARRFQPHRVILFGSHAYGEPDAGSDVDILVVMPHEGNPIDQASAIRRALDFPGFAFDLIVRDPETLRWRLDNQDWFLREIMTKGVVLYDAPHARMA